jgi:hypothetical protein
MIWVHFKITRLKLRPSNRAVGSVHIVTTDFNPLLAKLNCAMSAVGHGTYYMDRTYGSPLILAPKQRTEVRCYKIDRGYASLIKKMCA